MTRLSWNNPQDRRFETGLDRGVLYLRDGRVVPWNGLTGVDEEGSEGAAEYYIDGRPFLYLPKPKEYKAVLRAFTYPDEFSEVMGVVEATDGMYLDSQIGDSFGLSYRTKVGNATDGLDHAYKIHLVYNATVSPQSLTHESLSAEINPVEFAWEIQAVPVRVEGYRATAHIMIDTRHMDAEKIAQIEELLYGSATVDASMPNPQEIFDTLSFGDTIVITVHDDGTWTAEGSYKNIRMVAPGVFQIDNVNAEQHGDGTFTISTGGNTIVQED